MQTCVAGSELQKVECSGATPFCQKGANACSTTAEACGEVSQETFKCSAAGFFPNINDCSSYYQCAAKNGAVQRYQCPAGFNYFPELKNCKRSAACFKIDCTVKANLDAQYVIYRPDPTIYVFCTKDALGVASSHVIKCKPEGYSFVLASKVCEFVCLKEGRVADVNEKTMFYECYRYGTGYKYIHQTCLTGNVYSATEGFCIEEEAPVTTVETTGP